MINLKKLAGGTLMVAAAAIPGFAGDFFFSPEECMLRECRRMMYDCSRMMSPGFCQRGPERISVRECDKGYMIEFVTPGVPKEAYDISVTGNVLKISITKKECPKTKEAEAKDAKAKCAEVRKCPGYSQAYRLPEDADKAKIKAAYKDGIMKICIPKTKPEAKPEQKITIE